MPLNTLDPVGYTNVPQSVPSDNAQLGGQPLPSKEEEESVKLWRRRVKDAKIYFENDFKRMQENMEFAAGIQWQGQDSIDDKDDRYICNIITHHVNQKVASLYAKDPKCKARRRKRRDFTMWDGNVATLQAAQMGLQSGMASGNVGPQEVQAMMLMQDVAQGKQWEAMINNICDTLEILYQYQCDVQAPSFKFQMKQLVRRVITCGVGFVRLNYVTVGDHILSSSLTDDSVSMRLKRVRAIMDGVSEDEIPSDDPRIEQLKLLVNSIGVSIQQGDMTNIEERLEFDFPSANNIIIDPKCRCLKGFIGAEWVAQQFILPLATANAYYELRGDKQVKTGGEFVQYADDASEMPKPTADAKPKDVEKEPLGCFWEVFDLSTKTHFVIADGWKSYVQQPAPVSPSTNRFWPIFALTFNDVEVTPGQKVKIYPPSDVQLLKPMQKERNRTRDELKKHRKVNRPLFWGAKQALSEADKEKFELHETGEYIELESPAFTGTGQQADVNKMIGTWTGTPIDQAVYSTAPLNEDVNVVVGSNQIQQQQPIRHVAATPAVIQEQARMSDVNSNVDDLDDLLSELAQSSGEIMLRAFSPPTVQRVVGRGAVWPNQNREDFLNEVYLDIIAASSGRPNKAVDIANANTIMPLMLNAGANPWAIIQYLCKTLDANIDPSDFAPMVPPPQMGGPPGQPQHQGPVQQNQGKQPHQMPSHPGQPGVQNGAPSGVPLSQGAAM